MSAELNYNSISKRFDFEVPLEDISAQGDLHPRLKFIFQQSFELYLDTRLSIEDILNEQLCVQECLDLKQSIIYDKQPGMRRREHIGAYFWIIRHFLGLLPIPLLPSSTSTHKYPWQELSKKCRNLIKCSFKSPEQYNFLNYSISRSLNNLPYEHILLLNTVIVFIREISSKKMCKQTLKSLTRYYCDAIFLRPFTPGCQTDDKMLPLMIYMVSKWYQILKYLNNTYIPSFSTVNTFIRYGFDLEKSTTANSSTQTSQFTSILFMNKNVPSSSIKQNLFKNATSQTDSNSELKLASFSSQCSLSTMNKNERVLSRSIVPEEAGLSDISVIEKEPIYVKNVPSLKLRKLTSFMSSLVDINEDEENAKKNESVEHEEEYFHSQLELEEDTKYDSIPEDSRVFKSSISNDRDSKWNDVVAEISKTVKKVENYNYEDERYVTAIEESRSSSSPSVGSFSVTSASTVYASFTDTPPSKITSVGSEESNEKNKNDNNTKMNTSYYRSFYGSDDELYCFKDVDKNNYADDEESVSKYSVKRYKFGFDLFKSISPKLRRSGKVLKRIATRNIKYHKFSSASNS